MIGNDAQDAIRIRIKQIISEYIYTSPPRAAESSNGVMLRMSAASAD
jgi:hypothetical protein